MNDLDIKMGVAWYVVFVFSVTLHEAAHAYIARILGDSTAYEGGQVSLNPVPHIKREPFGMVILPMLSVMITGWPMGFASAPYNPMWAYNYPKRSAWMALAGPASNFLAAIIAGVMISILIFSGVLMSIPGGIFLLGGDGNISSIGIILGMLFFMNSVLAVFNLFPIPPLDGSGALPLFLKDSDARKYMEFISQPAFGLIGILIVWKVFPYVFGPIFGVLMSVFY